MRELFRQVSDPHPTVRHSRLSALPASIAVHILVLLAVVVIPLLASDALPDVRISDIVFRTVVLPPIPSPPPMPAARRAAPMAVSDASAAPVDSPTGIHRELLPEQPPTPDVAAPDSGGVVTVDLPPGLNTGVVVDGPPLLRPAAPVRVHSLLRPPVKVRDVPPIYPEAARLARVEGMVIIEAVIGPTGDVQETRILRSKPLLDQAALDAVRQWRYTPTLLNGVPVPVVMTVTVSFTLK
jgi:periplasmic protein TonB